jgi:hypothetical protein
MDSSRDAAALMLGGTDVLNFLASLFGAFLEGVLGNIDCAVAAGLLLVGVGEYIYESGLTQCLAARWGDAPEYPCSVSTRLDLRQNPEGVQSSIYLIGSRRLEKYIWDPVNLKNK